MIGQRRRVDRVLIVEDDARLRTALAGLAARKWNAVVCDADTAEGALSLLHPPPDLLICNVTLGDRFACDVFEAARTLSPEPATIAMGDFASPEETLRLARMGVREWLTKPFGLDELCAAVQRVLTEPPQLDPFLRASVGLVPIREVQRHVRRVMVDQALLLSRGSRSGAARLLGVSRQAVQQFIRSEDDRADDGDEHDHEEREAPSFTRGAA